MSPKEKQQIRLKNAKKIMPEAFADFAYMLQTDSSKPFAKCVELLKNTDQAWRK